MRSKSGWATGMHIIAKVSTNESEYPDLTSEQILFCAEHVAVETERYLRSAYPGADVRCCLSGHCSDTLHHLVTWNNSEQLIRETEIRANLCGRQREWVLNAIRRPDFPRNMSK